jgi:DNA-binding MarR family transcriptional regulator
VKETYIDMILSIERLHRRFLDVVKSELDRLKIEDINNVQTLILYNINDEELTVGELTNRGYYLGSNVSYNVKKLVENDYLLQERAPHDKRSVKIKLSEKGLKLCSVVDSLYKKHSDGLPQGGLTSEELTSLNNTLVKLEQFWSQHLSQLYRL